MEWANPDRGSEERGGPEAAVTQARENVASAEVGSASENTAVWLNKNHKG